jgi:hypothetical protein
MKNSGSGQAAVLRDRRPGSHLANPPGDRTQSRGVTVAQAFSEVALNNSFRVHVASHTQKGRSNR